MPVMRCTHRIRSCNHSPAYASMLVYPHACGWRRCARLPVADAALYARRTTCRDGCCMIDETIDPSYPRDLAGYGAHPPHPRWPGGARIALQFVLNVEEGAENCVLHGDAASETFLSEIIGAAAFTD